MSEINEKTSIGSELKPIGSFIYRHFKFVFCVIWFSFLIIEMTKCVRRDMRDVVVRQIVNELIIKDFSLDYKLSEMKKEITSKNDLKIS